MVLALVLGLGVVGDVEICGGSGGREGHAKDSPYSVPHIFERARGEEMVLRLHEDKLIRQEVR